jgi:hypothetical protein
MNSELEKASRVGDYLEVGELMCYDALTREESCGAHFREEHQTSDGEAARNDQDFAYISASTGEAPEANSIPIRHHVAEAALMLLHVSAAAPAAPPARTPVLRYLLPPRLLSSPCCHRAK